MPKVRFKQPNGSVYSISDDSTRNAQMEQTYQKIVTGNPNQIVGFDALGKMVAVDRSYELYGFELDLTESNPASKIKYLADNANYTPASMGSTSFSYGDWEDAFFIRELRPCMMNYDGSIAYDLNSNNYAQKIDGTASDVANSSFAGNAMMGIPTVWIKVDTTNPNKPKFYFSNIRVDLSFNAYAHHDNDGKVMDYTYMAIYNGYVDGSSRMRSISGVDPTRDQTGATQITECRANNPSGVNAWDLEKFVDRNLISLLLLLIGKSTNTQAVFGFGNDNGYHDHASGSDSYGVLPTGTMDDKGLFWGSTSLRNLGVKVFGIENFWGNIWERSLGLVAAYGTIYYKLTYGTEDGSTVIGFDPAYIADNASAPSGYIGAGPTLSNGYISNMAVGSDAALIPSSTTNGSDSTYFCDHSWWNTDNVYVALFGSSSHNGSRVGAFAVSLASVLSYRDWSVGARLSCKKL